jgi:hypothetical protein
MGRAEALLRTGRLDTNTALILAARDVLGKVKVD